MNSLKANLKSGLSSVKQQAIKAKDSYLQSRANNKTGQATSPNKRARAIQEFEEVAGVEGQDNVYLYGEKKPEAVEGSQNSKYQLDSAEMGDDNSPFYVVPSRPKPKVAAEEDFEVINPGEGAGQKKKGFFSMAKNQYYDLKGKALTKIKASRSDPLKDQQHIFYKNDMDELGERAKELPTLFVHPSLEKLTKAHIMLSENQPKTDPEQLAQAHKAVELINCLNTLIPAEDGSMKINLKKLCQLSFAKGGIPEGGLRPIIWRILLDSLPLDPAQWDSALQQNFDTYELWKKELIVDLEKIKSMYAADGLDMEVYQSDFEWSKKLYREMRIQEIRGKKKAHVGILDESDGNFSNEEQKISSTKYRIIWQNYFRDQDLIEDIQKDVKRTRTELNYFKEPTNPKDARGLSKEELAKRLDEQFETRQCDMTEQQKENYISTQSDALGRILFVYAKLNPGISYIQGMNEVLAVIFYAFETDSFALEHKYFESDCFAVFSKIMEELRDCFLRELDKEATGLEGHISHYRQVLECFDPDLHILIEEQCEVPHQFYVMRWFMLLMCQEFKIKEILRLWDTLLSAQGPDQVGSGDDKRRFKYLTYVVVALVEGEKQGIIDDGADFSVCMENLQKAPKNQIKGMKDLEDLIQRSTKVFAKWLKDGNEQ